MIWAALFLGLGSRGFCLVVVDGWFYFRGCPVVGRFCVADGLGRFVRGWVASAGDAVSPEFMAFFCAGFVLAFAARVLSGFGR